MIYCMNCGKQTDTTGGGCSSCGWTPNPGALYIVQHSWKCVKCGTIYTEPDNRVPPSDMTCRKCRYSEAVEYLRNLTFVDGKNQPYALSNWKGDERLTAARAIVDALCDQSVYGFASTEVMDDHLENEKVAHARRLEEVRAETAAEHELRLLSMASHHAAEESVMDKKIEIDALKTALEVERQRRRTCDEGWQKAKDELAAERARRERAEAETDKAKARSRAAAAASFNSDVARDDARAEADKLREQVEATALSRNCANDALRDATAEIAALKARTVNLPAPPATASAANVYYSAIKAIRAAGVKVEGV